MSSYPAFTRLLWQAIDAGREVEVFSNLFHVRPEWWELYSHPQVTLATSYYSDTASGHDAVTGRRGSHSRTRANIVEAVHRHIPIRVGIIDVLDGQRVLSRWMPCAGNVKERPLAHILSGHRMRELVSRIPAPQALCGPDGEDDECKPDSNGGDCAPAEREACGPAYN